MKRPQWFSDWLTNDYAHLVEKVDCLAGKIDKIANDARWVKWLMGFLLAAVIGGAIAIICT